MERTDFLKCPFHSLASMYFNSSDTSHDSFTFPEIPRGDGTAKYINEMFRNIKNDIERANFH
jgi:hypothetical protein